MDFSNYKNFKELKSNFNLIYDLNPGRFGPTYICEEDKDILIKHYHNKKAVAHLKELTQKYTKAIEVFNNKIPSFEIVPLLHVGEDYIIKRFMTYVIPFNELRNDGEALKVFQEIKNEVSKFDCDEELLKTVLENFETNSTYFSNQESKVLMTDLNF